MRNVMMMCCMLMAVASVAQVKVAFSEMRKLEVTYNKTTNIVFPAAITSVDRGSQDVLVQKAAGADNVLRIKANVKGFTETNLSVITADEKLYSFVVRYAEQPGVLNLTIEGDKESLPAAEMKMMKAGENLSVINKKKGNVHSVHDESAKVSLRLEGFFVKAAVIYCRLELRNQSRIDYDIDQFHFYIRDQKLGKRTASQEIEITPLSVIGDTTTIHAGESKKLVVSLPKFTIPDGKVMAIEMTEKNGGRNLLLQAKNRHVMKAKQL